MEARSRHLSGRENALTEAGHRFSETEIFLTGANGFLGKIILALLLDRYPEFKRIHILLRPRGELSAAERFQSEVLSSPPIRALSERARGGFQKLSVIAGDIAQDGCGIDASDLASLPGVGLIINCAGKVDFFPPVDDSLATNVDGVENIVFLAQRLGAKLLHVSTCFVCGEADGLIEETDPVAHFYPHRRGKSDKSFDHIEELGHTREIIRQIYDSDLAGGGNAGAGGRRSRELSQRLVALGKQRAAGWGWVNTYTYSKSIGEQIIAATEGLDYAIVRPAIVESSWRFPFPGWIEGGRTAAPLVLMALGGQKAWPVAGDSPLEVAPVDMTAAAILIVAERLLSGEHEPVYQLGSADVNPVTLGAIVGWLDEAARSRKNGRHGPGEALAGWLTGARSGSRVRFVSEEEAGEIRAKLLARAARAEGRMTRTAQWAGAARLPGNQVLARLAGELRKVALQSKFRDQTLDQYLPFVLRNRYVFESENIRAAYHALSSDDRERLAWRPEGIDWKDYWLHNQIEGIEKWVQPEAVREWSFKM